MPKLYNTRAQRAAELLERISRGPALEGSQEFTAQNLKDFSWHYRIWSTSWIIPQLIELIPELKKAEAQIPNTDDVIRSIAQQLGAKGGSSKSEAKRLASRQNGKRGGRPSKKAIAEANKWEGWDYGGGVDFDPTMSRPDFITKQGDKP